MQFSTKQTTGEVQTSDPAHRAGVASPNFLFQVKNLNANHQFRMSSDDSSRCVQFQFNLKKKKQSPPGGTRGHHVNRIRD